MIELELLGLHPDGNQLSLNDATGNRYLLPITDSLRAALRKDTTVAPTPDDDLKPMSPREIQAHIRAGMSVAQVSEIATVPASQITVFAHPIFAEREYTASRARNFRQSADAGSMTIEELVVSRLVPRGVSANEISWDATRETGGPWILSASYTIADTDHQAAWIINTRSQSVEATNDEAIWLTETQIPAPTSPWRPLNTPEVSPEMTPENVAEKAPSRVTAIDAQPASAGTPSIDDMLASLDSQRGKTRRMPGEDFFDGAHPATSDTDSIRDATVVELPTRPRPEPEPDESAATPPTADTAEGNTLPLGKEAIKRTPKRAQKRRNRPAMPSWDEIVFGAPKD
ncbi:septation protein SepH [Arcanobacterium buesumense]|uniref:DUF3071 domain-containing protein n=1 Tax=Arcanobacterium buesumense TaxID=2722751 RepID=A0A6H2EL48_9ACTO|nr:septation protein SepH [Arcanobacterium buesumense]QJC21691.1 DUF3071 domain-containing protein [Arcanobacterium buesumense]